MARRWSSAFMSVLLVASLLAALVLALLRVTDPTSRRLIELVSLTPLGVPVAGVAVLATAWWAFRRRRRTPALLAAAGLLVLHAWWLAPLYAGARPGSPSSSSFVVLAQNFEYGDPAALVDLVREEGVDVLVLTDVDDARVSELLAAGVEQVLPHAAGVGDNGSVVLSRIPVRRTTLLYEESESRLVDLEAPGIGIVTLAALHTAPPYRPDDWRADHEQIRTALATLRDDTARAIVLAGDLNATLAHAPVRRLLDLGFDDAAAQVNAGLSPTWPAGGHERRLGVAVPTFAAIDHVLTSPRLMVTAATTPELTNADHLGVLATVSGADPARG
ncbi:MAG: endonuclease/exonuclease/phosphatase family protein [Aeromicrobium sp.]